jgi:hypothetical protein
MRASIGFFRGAGELSTATSTLKDLHSAVELSSGDDAAMQPQQGQSDAEVTPRSRSRSSSRDSRSADSRDHSPSSPSEEDEKRREQHRMEE